MSTLSTSLWVLVVVVLVGWLAPRPALAQSSVRVPRIAAAADPTAHRVWASCSVADATQQHLAAVGLAAPAATSFDRNAWEAARARAVSEAPALGSSTEVGALVAPLAAQIAALASACSAVLQGSPLTIEQVRSFAVLATNPDLSWLQAQTQNLTAANLDGVSVAAAFTPPPAPPPTTAPASPAPTEAATPPSVPSMTDILLDEAQRKLVREALNALLKGACDPTKYRPYFEATCAALESLRASSEVQTFHQQLYAAAQEDLVRMPQVMLSRSQNLDDSVVTLWIVAVVLQDGLAHGDWPSLLRGLSALHCEGATQAACQQGTPRALKQLGELTATLDRHTRGLEGGITDDRLRVVALLVALDVSPSGTLEQIERSQKLAQTLSASLQALQSATAEDAVKVTFDYVLAYLGAQASASGVNEAQLKSLRACVLSARQGDLAASLSEAMSLAAKTAANLPEEVRALLMVIETLRGKASATALLEALAQSPWLGEKLAEQLRGRGMKRSFDPFGDAPRKRPGEEREREGVASYFGGVRAGYVYQSWKPQDIPDVAYSTVGLNLLRLELLLNVDKLPALQLLEGYFRYELAPGGQAEQDKLVTLYEEDASGWQAIVADLAADLPGLSDEDSLRGPAVGFTRRYFLASAQALKDYWYYDDQSVKLLAPGDKVQTTTVMTVFTLGFRNTTLQNSVPEWGWEAGGFYLDYRKPYTHSRFTSVDRAAIFDASFRGLGAYATGRLFIPSANPKAPGQLSLNAKFGHAEILLDDIVAADVLPGNSGVFMFETTAEVQFPVVWWGGFFIGGMSHATYRNFGDYFGGESDPNRVNDQSLNDDFIFGLTAQAGYLL